MPPSPSNLLYLLPRDCYAKVVESPETTRSPTHMQKQRVFIQAQAQTLWSLQWTERSWAGKTLPIYYSFSRGRGFPTWQLHDWLTFEKLQLGTFLLASSDFSLLCMIMANLINLFWELWNNRYFLPQTQLTVTNGGVAVIRKVVAVARGCLGS